MALSDDQRAMLRLLAQREQGYEDIAALMGLSVDDVRAKVKDALAQLEDEGVAAPPLPPEPAAPLAPAEPEPPATAPTPEPPDPTPTPPPAVEATPAQQPAAAATPPPASPAAPTTPKKPRDKNMLLAIGGGALAVVVIVVLAILLISNSGGDSNSDSDSGDVTTSVNDSTEQTTANGDEELDPTMATLKAVAGQSGSGTAVFGNYEEKLVLAVQAKDLEPSAAGTQYAIGIAASPSKILPIASTAVGAKGTIEASIELPAELLLYLANETYSEIVITRANAARLKSETNKGSKEPAYVGTPVLRGKITGSLVGNDEILQQVEEEKAAEAGG